MYEHVRKAVESKEVLLEWDYSKVVFLSYLSFFFSLFDWLSLSLLVAGQEARSSSAQRPVCDRAAQSQDSQFLHRLRENCSRIEVWLILVFVLSLCVHRLFWCFAARTGASRWQKLRKRLSAGLLIDPKVRVLFYFSRNFLFIFLLTVRAWQARTIEDTRKTGSTTTLMGRRRPLPEIVSPVAHRRSAAERAAINTPLQGKKKRDWFDWSNVLIDRFGCLLKPWFDRMFLKNLDLTKQSLFDWLNVLKSWLIDCSETLISHSQAVLLIWWWRRCCCCTITPSFADWDGSCCCKFTTNWLSKVSFVNQTCVCVLSLLLLQGPEESVDAAMAILLAVMKKPFQSPLRVELVVEARAGDDWFSCK